MNTTYHKGYHGQQATTETQLKGNLYLKISTMKTSSGKLSTTASCFTKDGMFQTHRVYQDYYVVLAARHASRVTAKAVKDQHDMYLSNIEQIKNMALEYYASPTYTAKHGMESNLHIDIKHLQLDNQS